MTVWTYASSRRDLDPSPLLFYIKCIDQLFVGALYKPDVTRMLRQETRKWVRKSQSNLFLTFKALSQIYIFLKKSFKADKETGNMSEGGTRHWKFFLHIVILSGILCKLCQVLRVEKTKKGLEREWPVRGNFFFVKFLFRTYREC